MVQTKPHDAASNLSAWLDKLGVTAPDFFIHPQIDKWATASFFIFGMICFVGPWAYKKFKQKPEKPTLDLADRDTKVDRALSYIETGNWDHNYGEFMGLAYPNKGSCFNKFRQAALDGKFKVWGKTGPYSPHIPIEKNYWEIWKLEVLSCMKGECKTEVSDHYNRVDKRYDLMVSKAEIEKTWPHKK